MVDEISNDINTLVIVEEQWTKVEQTVWKSPQHPPLNRARADSVEKPTNTRLAVYHASF